MHCKQVSTALTRVPILSNAIKTHLPSCKIFRGPMFQNKIQKLLQDYSLQDYIRQRIRTSTVTKKFGHIEEMARGIYLGAFI